MAELTDKDKEEFVTLMAEKMKEGAALAPLLTIALAKAGFKSELTRPAGMIAMLMIAFGMAKVASKMPPEVFGITAKLVADCITDMDKQRDANPELVAESYRMAREAMADIDKATGATDWGKLEPKDGKVH